MENSAAVTIMIVQLWLTTRFWPQMEIYSKVFEMAAPSQPHPLPVAEGCKSRLEIGDDFLEISLFQNPEQVATTIVQTYKPR